MTEETKIALTEFLEYLVKENYCDADVYAEPPGEGMTVIDEFISIKYHSPVILQAQSDQVNYKSIKCHNCGIDMPVPNPAPWGLGRKCTACGLYHIWL